MIRLILVAIPVSLFFILSILTLPLTWLIGLFSRQAKDRISFFLVTKTFFLVRLASPVGICVKNRNKESADSRTVDGEYELPVS